MFNFIQQAAAQAIGSGPETEEGVGAVAELARYAINNLDNWLAGLVIAVLAYIFAKLAKRIAQKRITEKVGENETDMIMLVGRVTYITILFIGLFMALKVAGLDLTVIAAAVGFGVGFAMKDLIMNFLAGIIVLASNQFGIGDYIKINDTFGKVVEVQSRATILQALDGTKIIVPNSDLFNNQVVSYTSNPFRRIEIPVGVEYRTDLEKAHKVLLETLKHHPKVQKEPAPAVVLEAFNDSSIDFLARFWVDSHENWFNIRSDLVIAIKIAFDQAKINIPFPMRTLVLDRESEDAMLKTTSLTKEEAAAFAKERDKKFEDDMDATSLAKDVDAKILPVLKPEMEIETQINTNNT